MDGRAAPQLEHLRHALLVASTGGHLKELHELRPRLGLDRVTWLTFDDEQSRSLLAGQDVHYLRWTGSRDYVNTVRNMKAARSHFLRHRYDVVVSTGAAIALSVLPVARSFGLACHYVESATRTASPSVTGRVLAGTPGVHRYTQYAACAGRRWTHAGSVFDGFAPRSADYRPIRKVVVALGTMRQWSFRAAVERLVVVLPAEAEVVWQTGHTDISGLGIEAVPLMPAEDLARHMREADLVVAHAGVGSTLDALDAGRQPLLLPRSSGRKEHVDDHQWAVAETLAQKGLAVVADAPGVTGQHLLDAASQRIVRVPAPAYVLVSANPVSREGAWHQSRLLSVRHKRLREPGSPLDPERRR